MRYQLANAFNNTLRLVGFKSVNAQFTLAFIAIIVLTSASALTLYLSMNSSAQTVNIAGRQRMLSQKLAKEVFLVSQNIINRQVMQSTITLFDTSHQNLLNGNIEERILPPQTKQIKQSLLEVQSLWTQYIATIDDYLNDSNSQPLQSLKTLQTLQAQSVDVLTKMNFTVGLITTHDANQLKRQQTITLIFAMLVLAIALVSRYLGLYWLMGQIRHLQIRLQNLAEGDFSNKIEIRSSDNEIGQILIAYNKIISDVGGLVSSVSHLSETVKTRSADLNQSADQAEVQICRQTQELDQVSAAMNEMTITVNEVAKFAQQASTNANDANDQACSSKNIVTQSVSNITELSNDLAQAASVMHQLDEDNQEIGKVLTVITGIAEQTNLLALNAAIEAARAGDQGRGFAVVADEVRTLAQRTQESTEEIQRIIERLQSQTIKAVKVMESSTDSSTSSANQIQETNTSLSNITKAIEQINLLNTQIATASQQQSEVSKEIDKNINNIASSANDTQQISKTVKSGAKLINQEVSELNTMLLRFKI